MRRQDGEAAGRKSSAAKEQPAIGREASVNTVS